MLSPTSVKGDGGKGRERAQRQGWRERGGEGNLYQNSYFHKMERIPYTIPLIASQTSDIPLAIQLLCITVERKLKLANYCSFARS